jgi:Na+/H+ antiporter
MILFEWTLALLAAAVLLTGLARRLDVPYPPLLALAGAALAFLPAHPNIEIEPDLALALFVAPVLLDAAYDTSPRDLWRSLAPLLSLTVVAVLLTTGVVAWLGWRYAGLPIAAAVTLGAIVAPPEAVTATAILRGMRLPRRMLQIMQGESLLNDATALLIYRMAVAAAVGGVAFGRAWPAAILAVVASPVAGFLLSRIFAVITRRVTDPASSTVLQFVGTFGIWILAERLSLSPIITTVAFAMTAAHGGPTTTAARNRVSSLSVWETAVFVLNVLAFVVMGLQARPILDRLSSGRPAEALGFSAAVLAAVILVRIVYVMSYVTLVRIKNRWLGARLPEGATPPSSRGGLLVSWTGTRGLISLATAFALPQGFPGRDLIVLAAFSVVIGTLVIQGLTLKPLALALKFTPDDSLEQEVSQGRMAVMRAALDCLKGETSPAAVAVREAYAAAREIATSEENPQGASEYDRLRLKALGAQRTRLHEIWSQGQIGDEAYHRLREELDWTELDASPASALRPLSTD